MTAKGTVTGAASSPAVYAASPVKRRRSTKAELAAVDDAVIAAIEEDAPVTVRGVFYRVESAGYVAKTNAGYDLIGRRLLKLRRSGHVPYADITDGTRWITKPRSWTGVEQMLRDASASYRRALWHDQDTEVHIFTEKDAISGVILPVTERWDVPLGVLRGYASESFAWSAAEAIKASPKRSVHVYQLGDHDPSGVDAWRAFRESVVGFLGERVTPEMVRQAATLGLGADFMTVGRVLGVREQERCEDCDCACRGDCHLELLHGNGCACGDQCDCPDDCGCGCALPDRVTYKFLSDSGCAPGFRTLTFARLAVTARQIEDWRLPTRPTKRSDSRATKFAGDSVEVDAIPAPQLREIVENAITRHIDRAALRATRFAEQSERDLLTRIIGAVA